MVLLEELGHVNNHVADDGQTRQRLQNDLARQGVHVGQTGEAVFTVDVHRVRTADTFAAGAAKADAGVNFFEFHQCVKQHAFRTVEFYLDGLHIWLGIGIGVVAVNFKRAFCHGVCLIRKYGSLRECCPR